jgi:CO/xanthine dehydrogenase FAD-binding subunit
VAIGSVAPTVVRLHRLEAYLAGGGREVAEAQRLAWEEIRPIDDVRSSAEYRRRVTGNLIAEWVRGMG